MNAPRPQPARGPVARGLWLAAGVGLVGLALVGIVLPLMPATVFFILAAGCFARSSPRLEALILDHPRIGPMVRDWRERKAIPASTKAMAIGGMAGGYGVFWWAARPDWPLGLGVAALMLAGAAYVLTRPS